MSKTRTIHIKRENIRPGDHVKAVYRYNDTEHPFEGEYWVLGRDGYVGQSWVFAGGRPRTGSDVHIISVTRTLPELPTEDGSVILNPVGRWTGNTYKGAFYLHNGRWHGTDDEGRPLVFGPDVILDFAPAQVVPA